MALYNTAIFYHVESMLVEDAGETDGLLSRRENSSNLSFAKVLDTIWSETMRGGLVMGQIAVHEAHADWDAFGDSHPRLASAAWHDEMNRLRIERVSVPGGSAHLEVVDQKLVVAVMKCLVQNAQLQIVVLVLGSNRIDRMASLVQTLRELGKTVVACAHRPAISHAGEQLLSNMFDCFVTSEPKLGSPLLNSRLQHQQQFPTGDLIASNKKRSSIVTPPTTPPPPSRPATPSDLSPLLLPPPLPPGFIPQPPLPPKGQSLPKSAAASLNAKALALTSTRVLTGTTVAIQASRQVLAAFQRKLESLHCAGVGAGTDDAFKVKDAICKQVADFAPMQYGFDTLTEYLQWMCTGTAMCVVHGPTGQIQVALRQVSPVALPDVNVHTMEMYRSILASTYNPPPYYRLPRPSTPRTLQAVADWLSHNPLTDVYLSAATEAIHQSLTPDEVSFEDIKSSLASLATAGIFSLEPKHAPLGIQRLSSQPTLQSRHDVLTALKKALKDKLLRVLGVVHQDVLNNLLFVSTKRTLGEFSGGGQANKHRKCGESTVACCKPDLPVTAAAAATAGKDPSLERGRPETTRAALPPLATAMTIVATKSITSSALSSQRQIANSTATGTNPLQDQRSSRFCQNIESDPSTSQMHALGIAQAVVTASTADKPTTAASPAKASNDPLVIDKVRQALTEYLRDPTSRAELLCQGMELSVVEKAIIRQFNLRADGSSHSTALFVEYMQYACTSTDLCLARLLEQDQSQSKQLQPVLVWRRWLPAGAVVLPDLDTAPSISSPGKKVGQRTRQRRNRALAKLAESKKSMNCKAK